MAVTSPTQRLARVSLPRRDRPGTSAVLLVGLLGACLYAAFAGGAVQLPEETWLQAGVALLAVLAATAWLGPGTLRPGAAPAAVAGLVALLLFAAWTGLSLLWSVTPDRTWLELNRVVAYTLVVAVALAAGGSRRAIERVALGWLVIAVAVALYALGGKIFPGVLDHATRIARLRAPLEYWNALGLMCVLGAPVALRVATARTLGHGRRIAGLLALFVLLCTLGMTYSRGGIVALLVALVVVTICGHQRLPGLVAFALALVAAAPVLAFAWTDDALAQNAQGLGDQIDAGLRLGAIVLGAGALIALAAWFLLRIEARASWSPDRSRHVWAALAAVTVALVAGGVTVLAQTDRGLGGSVRHAVDDFTQVRRDPIYDPGRLLTTSSANRWAWWREAAGATADRPVAGWGAGSFPVTHRLYRVSPSDVLQPHSLPMQLLAETGVIGAILLLSAFGLLLAAAIGCVRALRPGLERDLAGALLAGVAAWCVHACFDWDWDIPGVTLPMLVFLGVLGARERPDPTAVEAAFAENAGAGRALALAATVLACLAVLVSAVLPAWSDAKADAALGAVGTDRRSEQRLEDAAAAADLSARLDPVAVRPLFAAAAVAEARGRLLEARERLLEAVDRQPYSLEAWTRLTRIALALADRQGVLSASRRALALDPGNPRLVQFVRRAQGILAPPEASPTATGTPLPPAGATGAATTPPPAATTTSPGTTTMTSKP